MKKYLLGYRHPSCQLYKPKVNRKRQFGLMGMIVAFGFLPGPNFIGAAITKMILKVNPLFMYT